MHALLAFLPILAVIILMTVFNWGSLKALFLGWFFTVLIALFFWNMDFLNVVGYSFYGVQKAFGVIIIIYGLAAALFIGILIKTGNFQ